MKNSCLSFNSKIRAVCGVVLLAACLLVSGCASKQGPVWREYKVFCGMSFKHGEVSEQAWEAFCNQYVSTAFPDGYTVIDADGNWQDAPSAIEKERSKLILILAPADARSKVFSIAEQYRKQFSQEAVLICISDVETELVGTGEMKRHTKD